MKNKRTSAYPAVESLYYLECRRVDYVGAAHVNAALTILQLLGLRRATKLLQEERISAEVIDRVLQEGSLVRPHGPSRRMLDRLDDPLPKSELGI